ncbi:MAG: helix-turn-helix domain-containing protein [Actinomycetota bacterium]|nr:helix-turn-helix domain-containing protein [Actinomycetota bacterium]
MATRSARKAASAPFGKDEVAAAILAAASDLFAEKGPAATSIREVATRSKVNHGLVFRHFGTKDNLVGAVLDHLAGQVTALITAKAPGAEVEQALTRHARVMARAILDGYSVGELQSNFPNLALLLDRIRPNFDDDLDARLAAANISALQLGWYLFRPFLQRALELDEVDDETLRGSISTSVAAIIDGSQTR